MKSRNEYIDIAKGIAIFLVVWGHVIKYTLPTGNDIYNLIYSFHMPVFFCISGYFANNTFLRESAIVFFLKKVIPFYFHSLFGEPYMHTTRICLPPAYFSINII